MFYCGGLVQFMRMALMSVKPWPPSVSNVQDFSSAGNLHGSLVKTSQTNC